MLLLREAALLRRRVVAENNYTSMPLELNEVSGCCGGVVVGQAHECLPRLTLQLSRRLAIFGHLLTHLPALTKGGNLNITTTPPFLLIHIFGVLIFLT